MDTPPLPESFPAADAAWLVEFTTRAVARHFASAAEGARLADIAERLIRLDAAAFGCPNVAAPVHIHCLRCGETWADRVPVQGKIGIVCNCVLGSAAGLEYRAKRGADLYRQVLEVTGAKDPGGALLSCISAALEGVAQRDRPFSPRPPTERETALYTVGVLVGAAGLIENPSNRERILELVAKVRDDLFPVGR